MAEAKPRCQGSDCRKWLVGQMRASLKKPQSKAKYHTEALSLFPTLGKRAFERAWGRAIEEAEAVNWSKAGAPKRQ